MLQSAVLSSNKYNHDEILRRLKHLQLNYRMGLNWLFIIN